MDEKDDEDNVVSLFGDFEDPTASLSAATEYVTAEKTDMIRSLSEIIDLIKSDKIIGYALIGHSEQGEILTEISSINFQKHANVHALLSGVHALEMEITDMEQLMPEMLLDGTIMPRITFMDGLND